MFIVLCIFPIWSPYYLQYMVTLNIFMYSAGIHIYFSDYHLLFSAYGHPKPCKLHSCNLKFKSPYRVYSSLQSQQHKFFCYSFFPLSSCTSIPHINIFGLFAVESFGGLQFCNCFGALLFIVVIFRQIRFVQPFSPPQIALLRQREEREREREMGNNGAGETPTSWDFGARIWFEMGAICILCEIVCCEACE